MSESTSITVPTVPVEQPVESEPTRNQPPQPAGASSTTPMVLALLAMGISIGLAVAAYFTWNELRQLTATQSRVDTQLEDRIQPLRASLNDVNQTMQASLSTVNQALQSDRQQIDRQLKKLGEDQLSAGRRVSALAALMGRSEQGWSLAEVEYLLRIANQRLQLQRDVKTAEQALNEADKRLHDLADPHFLNVREQIATDLKAVQAVPVVDIEGISLSLSTALSAIDQLSVAGAHYQPVAQTETGASESRATISDWRELPRLLWSTLSGLFRIREHDKPVAPMLAPEREYFLRENLRLQFSAARLALLRDDGVQYQAILATAKNWLNAYFAGDDAEVIELVAQLEQLETIDTVPQLPDISGSLRVLRQQMKLSEQTAVLPLVPDQPVPGGAGEPELKETPKESDEGTAS
ncbi:MAG: uroporphyrinogen-III C-methyltransferase [Thiogranum sp.]